MFLIGQMRLFLISQFDKQDKHVYALEISWHLYCATLLIINRKLSTTFPVKAFQRWMAIANKI